MCTSFLLLGTSSMSAQLRLAKIFNDHMVLQRDQDIVVWGWAPVGEEVVIDFLEAKEKVVAGPDGAWKVTFAGKPAGGPYVLKVSTATEEIALQDILLGDVWLCSGQSNMEWPVGYANNPDIEIANAKDAQIRHYKVPTSYAEAPEADLEGGDWQVNDPSTVADFTAVGYFFAREIREEEQVPIGLINSSWGGSRLEPWMSAMALGQENPAAAIAAYRAEAEERTAAQVARLNKLFPGITTKDPGLVEGLAHWAAVDLDLVGWQKIVTPGFWEDKGYKDLDGICWYRTSFELTAEEAAAGVNLSLAYIDDSDITYVNGQEVGGMEQAYNVLREYALPASALQTGKNVIAVRVEDTGGGGGIYGDNDLLRVVTPKRVISLAGDWYFRIGALRSSDWNRNQQPMVLYNKMIFPLLDFPIKGVLWYQGESNGGSKADATAYRGLFADMISAWRQEWGIGDFPFLYVQLANFMQADTEPSESDWAILRESQSAALDLPNTGQAVIIDIGEAADIHPRNKQDVGKRLALAARQLTYGASVPFSGPTYKSMEIADEAIWISFDHVYDGLECVDKYGYVKGFAIAGADGRFVWAKARIEGERVRVWNELIKAPKEVRYAWGNNPEDANLYNKAGLPTCPFRTDKN